jgi:hypothetical protein
MIVGRILRTTRRWCLGGVVGGMIVLGVQEQAVAASNHVVDVTMFMEGEVQGVDTHGNAFAAPVNLTDRDLMNIAMGLRPRINPREQVVLGLVQLANTNTLPLIVFNAKDSSNVVTVGTMTLDPAYPTQPKNNATVFVQVDLLNVGGASNRVVNGQFFFAGDARFETNGCLKKLSGKGVGALTAQFNATNATEVIVYRAQFNTRGSKLGTLVEP